MLILWSQMLEYLKKGLGITAIFAMLCSDGLAEKLNYKRHSSDCNKPKIENRQKLKQISKLELIAQKADLSQKTLSKNF